MDELDQLILQTLQKDGRTPFTHIAKEGGVSETTIRSRYRSLVEDGVIRTVGIVDPYALGLEAPAIIIVRVEPGSGHSVATAICRLPEVSYQVMTLGSADLIVEVFCRDLKHLTDLSTEHIARIPGVRSTETLVIGRSYKLSYRWSPIPSLEGDVDQDTMVEVHVKLFGTFRPLLPGDAREGVWLTKVPVGTRAVEVLDLIGVPLDRLETTVILVNGRRKSPDWILEHGDVLSAFPAMEGG